MDLKRRAEDGNLFLRQSLAAAFLLVRTAAILDNSRWPIVEMGVSKNNGTPKSSILIRLSIIFTIHFGGFPPSFGNIQICFVQLKNVSAMAVTPIFFEGRRLEKKNSLEV